MNQETKKHLQFQRVFSDPDHNPYEELEWELRNVAITDDSGKAIFSQENVEVPKSWSPLATKIAVSKYFYGDQAKGFDPHNGGRESSVKQLIDRVVKTIAKFGLQDGYFETQEDANLFEDELRWLCVNQYAAFNSPVWFNVGLYHEYGVGKQSPGNYVYDRAGGAQLWTNQYEYPQGSACFIQSVNDDMEGIMDLARSEAMLFKYGSGSGTDLSPLRSTREKLSGGGKPSGPLSFLKVYDAIAGTIKSGGKTRRAAKMNTLFYWHPDIEEFITAKSEEEKKAWALIEQGYDGSFNGPAYGSVAFQNENLSVRVSDEFMKKADSFSEVSPEGEYDTLAATDKRPIEKKNARQMLRKIAEGTWLCGDPGMQFDDTIHNWHTCKGTDRQYSTNPCSEYLFLNNTACNLASLNLLKFKNSDGGFNVTRYKAAVRLILTAQEIIVDRASYPTEAIAVNSHIFRTLGLGYANLGALLMSYGVGYDSDEGRAIAGALTAIMTGEAYYQSAIMADALGAFPGYEDASCFGISQPLDKSNVPYMQEVIERHCKAAHDLPPLTYHDYLRVAAENAWDNARGLGRKVGFRNAQVTVLAPTGTIGFLMDCDTTGIEPAIALTIYKLLAGGGMLKIVNQSVAPALRTLDYSDKQIAQILTHIERYDTIEDVGAAGGVVKSGLNPHHLSVFDCAFKAEHGQRSLHYLGHIKMMAACQPFLSGAISKTVNLPESATVEDIMNTYVEGWKLGLKAIAIYRDGSKRSAPLNTKKTKDMGAVEAVHIAQENVPVDHRLEELQAYVATLEAAHGQPVRKKMPDTRTSVTHKFEVGGQKGYITAGLHADGSLGEIFVQMSKEGSTIGGLMDSLATVTSIALQYGVPLETLVRKFAYQRFEPAGYTRNPHIRQATSLVDYVFRWLGGEFLEGYKDLTAAKPMGVDGPGGGSITIKPDGEIEVQAGGKIDLKVAPSAAATSAANTGFLPDPCGNCGSSKVIRAGACGCCTECGTSQGCS